MGHHAHRAAQVDEPRRNKLELPSALALLPLHWPRVEAQQLHVEAPRDQRVTALMQHRGGKYGDGEQNQPGDSPAVQQSVGTRPVPAEIHATELQDNRQRGKCAIHQWMGPVAGDRRALYGRNLGRRHGIAQREQNDSCHANHDKIYSIPDGKSCVYAAGILCLIQNHSRPSAR